MKKLLLASVAALSVLSASAAHTAEIKVLRLFADSTWVSVSGKIEHKDSVVFKKYTEAIKGDVVVWLSSPGGDARAAILIGSFIHMNQWTTSVGFGNRCSSACAIIWLSGVHRRLSTDARIGVHSMAMPDGSGKRNDLGNGIVFGYLRSIGVGEEIIERFYKTDPSGMDFIDYEQALHLELLSDPTPAPSKKGDQWWNPKPIPPAGPMPVPMKILKTNDDDWYRKRCVENALIRHEDNIRHGQRGWWFQQGADYLDAPVAEIESCYIHFPLANP